MMLATGLTHHFGAFGMPSLARASRHVHQLTPYYYAPRPASVIANPAILMLSIFGLFGGSMLVLALLHGIRGEARTAALPWRHPATANRLITVCLLLSILSLSAARAAVFMSWPDISAEHRYLLSITSRITDFMAVIPLGIAGLLRMFAQPTIDYQLKREPIPVNLWPAWQQLRRPAGIALLLLLVSVLLSFGR